MSTSFAFFSLVPFLGFFSMLGGMSPPLGLPPLPEDPVLSRVAPQECLAYVSWAGSSVPDAKSANHTEKLLAEGEVQRMLKAIDSAVISAITKGNTSPSGEAKVAADLYPWAKYVLMRPASLFVSKVAIDRQGVDVRAGGIFNLDTRVATAAEIIERYEAMLPADAVQKIEVAGVAVHRIKTPASPISWAVQKRYLIVGIGEGSMEGILELARQQPPQWLATLRKQVPVERLSTLTYINVRQIAAQFGPLGGPQLQQVLDMGFGNIKSLVSVTGMEGSGCVGRTLVELDGEPTGLLTLASAKPLAASDLSPIPADATLAFTARIDIGSAMELMLRQAEKVEPRIRQDALQGIGQMEESLGIKVQDDLLKPLGDVWCAYNSPSEGGFLVTGFTAVVQVKDHDRLAATLAKLVARGKLAMRQESEAGEGQSVVASPRRGGAQPRIEQFTFAGQTVYHFNAGAFNDLPFAPAWCLTEKELIFSTFPQHIKSYLARGTDQKSLATLPAIAEEFAKGGPISLTYCDTRKVAETLYPLACFAGRGISGDLARNGIAFDMSVIPSAAAILPHLQPSIGLVRRTEFGIEIVNRGSLPSAGVGAILPLSVAWILPATTQARSAAKRTQSMNNLKQIALCMLNYEANYNKFPSAFSSDKQSGKPLLSWRVAVLPYLEENALYKEFHLDEPWDSDHNKKLIARMPATFRSPASLAAPGKTNYVTVRHKDGVFPGKDGVRMADISDGASNTLLAVEVNDANAVIWTKPDDLEFDPQKPLAGLSGLWPNGFNAVFCDGHVQFISASVPAEIIRNMVYRNDGHVSESP